MTGETYDARCPSCDTVNHLIDSDLGVRLKCGSCGQPFVFGAEILEKRKSEKLREKEKAKWEAEYAKERARREAAERKKAEAELKVAQAAVAATPETPAAAVEVLTLAPASAIRPRVGLIRRRIAHLVIAIILIGTPLLKVASDWQVEKQAALAPAVPQKLTVSEYKKAVLLICERMRVLNANAEKGVTIQQFDEKFDVIREAYFEVAATASSTDKMRESFTMLSKTIDEYQGMRKALVELIFAKPRDKDEKQQEWESAALGAMLFQGGIESTLSREP